MGLTFIAIMLLVAAWAALWLPDFRKLRGGSRRRDSIASFSHQLNVLDRARPGFRPNARVVAFPQRAGNPNAFVRPPVPRSAASRHAPRSTAQARARRARVLFGLLATAVVTLLAGFGVSPIVLVLHLLVDAVLGGYVWLVVQHNRQLLARRAPSAAPRARYDAEVRPIRRTASGS